MKPWAFSAHDLDLLVWEMRDALVDEAALVSQEWKAKNGPHQKRGWAGSRGQDEDTSRRPGAFLQLTLVQGSLPGPHTHQRT